MRLDVTHRHKLRYIIPSTLWIDLLNSFVLLVWFCKVKKVIFLESHARTPGYGVANKYRKRFICPKFFNV